MYFLSRAAIAAILVISFLSTNAGVECTNTAHTKTSSIGLKALKIGDVLLCANMHDLSLEETTITSVDDVEASEVIEITTSDNVTFCVAKDQKFFVTHKWVEAEHLSLGDVLLRMDKTFVKIMSIRHIVDKPTTLRYITLKEHHCYFIGENGILVHNGPLAAHQAYWATKLSLYTALGLTAGAVVVAGGAVAVAGVQAIGSATTALAAAKGAADVAAGLVVANAAATTAGVTVTAEIGGSLVAGGLIATGTAAETAAVVGTVTSVTASTMGTALAADAAILAGEATAATGVAASTLAAIEAAAMSAFAAALVCPWTPW